MQERSVILLSGGLDSTTALAMAISMKHEVHAISFDYHQRHRIELDYAKKIANSFKIVHKILKLDNSIFAGTSLVDQNMNLENGKDVRSSQIPNTYVPARNILFLTYALCYAESLNMDNIFIGITAEDGSNYPDCRAEFVSAFQQMANIGTKRGRIGTPIKILTPLINMRKSAIILAGARLGVDYSITNSCYNPDILGRACGKCLSCTLRKNAFLEAEVPDVTRYR